MAVQISRKWLLIGFLVFSVVLYLIPPVLDLLIKSTASQTPTTVQSVQSDVAPTAADVATSKTDGPVTLLTGGQGIKKTLSAVDSKLKNIQNEAAKQAQVLDEALGNTPQVNAEQSETKSVTDVMKEGKLIDKIKAIDAAKQDLP